MTPQDEQYRQGRSEAQYKSTMICLTISIIGLIVTFLFILITNMITL